MLGLKCSIGAARSLQSLLISFPFFLSLSFRSEIQATAKMASSHQPLSPPVISPALQHSFANFRALVHDLHFLDDDPVEWIALRDSLKALTITRWHELEIKDNKSARDDSEQCAFYGLGIEKEL